MSMDIFILCIFEDVNVRMQVIKFKCSLTLTALRMLIRATVRSTEYASHLYLYSAMDIPPFESVHLVSSGSLAHFHQLA